MLCDFGVLISAGAADAFPVVVVVVVVVVFRPLRSCEDAPSGSPGAAKVGLGFGGPCTVMTFIAIL